MDWKQQISIRNKIGNHPNVLCLVHHFAKSYYNDSNLFFVFKPLLRVTLADTLVTDKIDAWAQVYLLRDWARGLEHLHNDCGIMHRDIRPRNLGIDMCTPQRGVLIGLDRATDEPGSYDWRGMTTFCMVPEVMTMKLEGVDPMAEHLFPSYGRSIDVWVLGISTLEMIMDGGYSWNRFRPCKHPRAKEIRDADKRGFVTLERFPEDHDVFLNRLSNVYSDDQKGTLVHLCSWMTAFEPKDRISPKEIVGATDEIVAGKSAPEDKHDRAWKFGKPCLQVSRQ